ncbi:MAG: hypothetical protein GXO55_08775 [Chloroflexi bacterium]|nr:hypothetical protein [Chloroflexota bacterium]
MIRRMGVWLVLLGIGIGAILMPLYRNWRAQQGIIPPGITLGGVPLNGHDLAEVEEQLNAIFATPVAVYYEKERLILNPEDIGFRVKTRVMIGQARTMGTPFYVAKAFLASLLGYSLPPQDVPLLVEWDPQKLDAWLDEVAQRHDRPARPPQVMMTTEKTFDWRPGAPGKQLDKSASIPQIIAAFKQVGDARVAHLVIREEPPPRPDIHVLQTALQKRLDHFPGIASLFLRVLETGEEVDIHGDDVAYSGMSTMKIPILLTVYKELDHLPRGELRSWMRETITSTTGAGNYTANRVLRFLGQGDPVRGAEKVTAFLRELGFRNSFIIAPYDWRGPPPRQVKTPANQNPKITTYPDPLVQTTAKEIGLILEMVVECSEGKGTLLAAYPDEFTPEECADLLDTLAQNPVRDALLPGGLPEGVRYVHKHGYAPDTHGDVAAIWGPEGPYVLVLFLSTPNQWLVWDLSNPTFEDISRLVWEFFQFREGQNP